MADRLIIMKDDAGGSWQAVLSQPCLAVRPFVVGNYVGWSESTEAIIRRRELPVLFVPVILGFRAPFNVSGVRATSFLAGACRGFTEVESAGTVQCLQVNLTHDAACRLLGRRMGDLADCIVSISDALGVSGSRLIERLGNTDDWQSRFDCLDQFLADRLLQSEGLSSNVKLALAKIAATDGAVLMRDLTSNTGRSHKQLIRDFRSEIGLPPKLIARILRFNRALDQMHSGTMDLAEIALEAGYFDQAHFNRDFRAFAGVSPTAYLREHNPGLHLQA